jgi:hypothetical protein
MSLRSTDARPRGSRGVAGRLLLSALAVSAISLFAVSSFASAKIYVDPAGHVFGVAPSLSALPAGAAPFPAPCNAWPQGSPDCALLSYQGGAVMSGERDYLLFWVPSGHSVPAAYETGLKTFVQGIAGADYTAGNPFSVNQQYYSLSGSTKTFVPYAHVYAGTLVDTDPYPSTSSCTDVDGNGTTLPICITDAQYQTELVNYVNAHHLPTGLANEYFVFTPSGVGSCMGGGACAYSTYCGYHSNATDGSATLIYTNMPWLYNEPGCDLNATGFPVGYPNQLQSDAETSVVSHEASESMTDPVGGGGWWQTAAGPDQGAEIGDKCAYIYGPGGVASTTGLPNNGHGFYNTTLGGKNYLLQLEFDNRVANCAVKSTDVQPTMTVTITPSSPVHGSAATFKATVTDSNGIRLVRWSYGDGAAGSGTTTTHTYAAAGTYTVQTFVTDNHGQEARVITHVTVS